MRKVKCPVCEKTKRPYGLPRTNKPRAGQPHQFEYERGVYEIPCDACGTVLFVRMDYIPELAPVDIKEVWTADGKAGEVVEEKRATSKQPKPKPRKVNEEDITLPKEEE